MPGQPNKTDDRSREGSVFLSPLRRWWARSRRLRLLRQHPPVIVTDETGFALTQLDQTRWRIGWDDVVRVVGFKRDLYTRDLVCLGFVVRGDEGRVWCVHEELEGYASIQRGIETRTRGAWPLKFQEVAFPAFEANFTVVWSDAGFGGSCGEPEFVWVG